MFFSLSLLLFLFPLFVTNKQQQSVSVALGFFFHFSISLSLSLPPSLPHSFLVSRKRKKSRILRKLTQSKSCTLPPTLSPFFVCFLNVPCGLYFVFSEKASDWNLSLVHSWPFHKIKSPLEEKKEEKRVQSNRMERLKMRERGRKGKKDKEKQWNKMKNWKNKRLPAMKEIKKDNTKIQRKSERERERERGREKRKSKAMSF